MDKLITTKLLIPPSRPVLVSRPRLIEKLDSFIYPGSRLILVTAPAGYGKTTLITEWLSCFDAEPGSREMPEITAVWFSIDDSDNDPVRFLSYLNAALRGIEGIEISSERNSFGMLYSPKPPPLKLALTALINDIAAFPETIIFVLDDYHLIDNSVIHGALGLFLDNLPPQMHLVIITREDPPLPLSRLRSRGQLSEMRAADLRFRTSEVAEYLNQVMGLDLSTNSISSLENRTEGWIAGLQLAALSMRGSKDTSSFIKAFTGSHRLVQDFLIDEVLSQQSNEILNFLLQTSILDRLSGPICDHLTGQTDSLSILGYLERTNLFIVPLDEERRWYRYHHLFSELLRQHLKQTKPEELTTLHQKAIEWYEQNGLIDEAIDHALRAEYYEQASQLIGKNLDTLWAHGEYAKMRRWLAGLPEEQVLSIPQLAIYKAWVYFASGRLDVAIKFLQEAELISSHDSNQSSEAQSQEEPLSSSELEVPGRAADFQAWMAAYMRGNVSGVINHLSQVLANIPENDMHWRGAVSLILADAHAFNGNLPGSYRARLEILRACEATGNTYLYLYNSAKLALNLKIQGQLLHVQELCQQRMQFAKDKGLSTTAAAGWLLAIWSESLAEMNKLDEASALIEKSLKLTEHGGDADVLGWSYLSLIRILFAMEDMAGAEENIQKIFRLADEYILPTWIIYQNWAWQLRIWLAQDKLETASQWINQRNIDLSNTSFYIEGWEHIGIARVLINKGKWEKAISILDQLLEPAQIGGDITREIELLILQALAFNAGGEIDQSLKILEQALILAESKGFFQIFIDEGQPLASLLYTALDRGLNSSYVSRLLLAFPADTPPQGDRIHQKSDKHALIEPLSDREKEVLLLIAAGLTNPEIASKLILSLHTVKAHARNIYSKLDVGNRTEAVTKARTLGILADT